MHWSLLGTMSTTCYGQYMQLLAYCIVLVADVVKVISELLTSTQHDQIRRHSTLCLLSLAKTLSGNWSTHCTAELRETLEENTRSLNDPEYEVINNYLLN